MTRTTFFRDFIQQNFFLFEGCIGRASCTLEYFFRLIAKEGLYFTSLNPQGIASCAYLIIVFFGFLPM